MAKIYITGHKNPDLDSIVRSGEYPVSWEIEFGDDPNVVNVTDIIVEHNTAYIIMEYIKGPDFPTGGIVINKDELLSIYESGTGKIRLRG